MGVPRGPGASAVLASILLITLVGCVSFDTRTSGAASVEDFQAENAYLAVYMEHMSTYAKDVKVFAPSGTDPGPCNEGGTKQGCYDADKQVIASLTAMLSAIQGTKVPPRFLEADRLLRDALAKNINGLDLRNQAIAKADDALWQQHVQALQDAQAAWTAAYAAFPADNKPPLGP
jgi:hypothetical protein